MVDEEVPFERLPDCVKAGLSGRRDLADSFWVKRKVSLEELREITIREPEKEENRKRIQHYKEKYLKRKKVCPPVLEIIGDVGSCLWHADGFHRLKAYSMAADEDDALPKHIECWVEVR